MYRCIGVDVGFVEQQAQTKQQAGKGQLVNQRLGREAAWIADDFHADALTSSKYGDDFYLDG